MLTIAFTLVALPTANAQAYTTKNTFAVIGVKPNPVGVGQEVLVWLGVTDMLYVYTDGWVGLTVTVTRPDGTTETLGPFRTDSTGSTGTGYTPTMVGTYTFQTHFPAQWYNWTRPAIFDPDLFGPIWYKASDSKKLTLIVQQEPIEYYPGVPLPTEYWTRPIDAQHREWSSISGNWVTTPPNSFAPYNDDAPESAHILWAKQLVTGGLAGGELGEHGFEDGDAYEGFFSGSVIIAGVLYYNQYKASGGTAVEQEVVAVDLKTGEELWRRSWNNTRLAFGQVFYWESFNYYGTFAYLWSTTTVGFGAAAVTYWDAYEPVSGRWVYRMTDVPTAAVQFGPSYTVRGARGEIYIYNINLAAGWVSLWNSSRVGSSQGSWGSAVLGRTLNGTRGYEWNKTITKGLPGSVNAIFLQDRVVGSTAGGWAGVGDAPITIWALSLKPGQEGQLLFNKNWSLPQADLTIAFGAASAEDGVFTLRAKETRQWWGFSLDSGEKLWGPTASEGDLGIFGMIGNIAYGKLYAANKYSGILYCYDVKTGALLWNYTATDKYNEILWGTAWPVYPVFITDGKVYLGHSEHSGNNPKPRGAPFICLNATTGEEIWKIDGAFRTTDWGGKPVIGDSIIAGYNSYDQLIYAIGKGPSATTVTASPKVSVHGSSVLVEGMVTDVSPGAKEYARTARFPSGVPAVSDASMSEWMKYVYMQFPRPANATGVEVTLDAVDPNGNFVHIGTATSDTSGTFSYQWTPEVPGKYTVIATFAGSESYYASYAETAIGVDEAPAAPAAPEPAAPLPPYETYTIGAAIAIIIAVAIATILILRKRP
jgi:outer membrane protein assembly factor BamB